MDHRYRLAHRHSWQLPRGGQAALGGEGVVVGLAGDLAGGAEHVRLVGGGAVAMAAAPARGRACAIPIHKEN